MLTVILCLVLLLPVAGAVMAGRARPDESRGIAVRATLVAALLAIWAAWAAFPSGYQIRLGGLPWLRQDTGAALFGLLLDPLATILLLVVTIIGFLTVLYSHGYLTEHNQEHHGTPEDQRRYYFWLLAFMASMVGVATAPNFLQLFLFWELTTVCSWSLISFYRSPGSLRAGFKAILMTHAGGLFFIAALLVMFVQTGSFDFDAPSRMNENLRGWVYGFLLIAAWAKAAQVPLHTWLPDAMEAPTPISAYLHAAAMVKAGVFLMARAVSSGWAVPHGVGLLMAVMAFVTMLIALSFYFLQDDLKRLLAYSTIAHLGYVLLGVAIGAMGSPVGLQGGVLHIICHAFGKATLFLCVGAVAWITGSRSISRLRGVARVMPITAAAYFIGVVTVTGIPPFAGFWSKFMILAGAIRLPSPMGPVIVTLVLVESLVAFGWMLRVGQVVFLGPWMPTGVERQPILLPRSMKAALWVLMLGCLVAPVIGIPLVHRIAP
jgi:hydrogenase-4 component D